MSGVWNVRKRLDREREYLQKSLNLIKEIHMEDSEIASYTYYNWGNLLDREGRVDDAIAFYKYAIKIQEKIYGEKNN